MVAVVDSDTWSPSYAGTILAAIFKLAMKHHGTESKDLRTPYVKELLSVLKRQYAVRYVRYFCWWWCCCCWWRWCCDYNLYTSTNIITTSYYHTRLQELGDIVGLNKLVFDGYSREQHYLLCIYPLGNHAWCIVNNHPSTCRHPCNISNCFHHHLRHTLGGG